MRAAVVIAPADVSQAGNRQGCSTRIANLEFADQRKSVDQSSTTSGFDLFGQRICFAHLFYWQLLASLTGNIGDTTFRRTIWE